MGRFSGLISSAVFVGLFAILIYFCCRVKRKGAVIQRANANTFDNTAAATTVTIQQQYPHPTPMSGGFVGVGYPQQSIHQQYAPSPHHGVYGPTTQPYPMSNATTSNSNLPYPIHGGSGGMPMPGMGHNAFQQSGAPYPMAPTAPSSDDYDKPPAYEDVIRQQH